MDVNRNRIVRVDETGTMAVDRGSVSGESGSHGHGRGGETRGRFGSLLGGSRTSGEQIEITGWIFARARAHCSDPFHHLPQRKASRENIHAIHLRKG